MRVWIVTPLLGALIGYFTNWLAIKMLFRPHTEKRLFGVRLPFTPGLIPKERHTLAKKVADTLTGNVLTEEVMAEAVASEAVMGRIDALIDEGLARLSESGLTVREALARLLGGDAAVTELLEKMQGPAAAALPKISAYVRALDTHQPQADEAMRQMAAKVAREQLGGFVGIFVQYDKLYDRIKASLCDYLDDDANDVAANAGAWLSRYLTDGLGARRLSDLYSQLPQDAAAHIKPALSAAARAALTKGGAVLARSLDLGRVVEDKINGFAVDEAERIIISVVNRELKLITALGGLLGFVIGFAPAVMSLFGR